MKLLIVDDSLIVRNAIERVAQQQKIEEVIHACDGKEGVELFKKHKPEMVTMDLTMPHMDGIRCLSQIAQIDSKPSILVISAINGHGSAMKAVDLGTCGFVLKPFKDSELKDALGKLVKHAMGEDD